MPRTDLDRDTSRFLHLMDRATDLDYITDDLGDANSDDLYFGPIPPETEAAFQRRVALCQQAALGAIAFLLLRQDEEMWQAWGRY